MNSSYAISRDEIIEKLDVDKMLELLEINPSETVKVGHTVKAVCPVCNTKAFKTLFLERDRLTFGCRYTMCHAHSGEGDFLTLLEMAWRISEQETLHRVAGHLGLEVGDEAADELAHDLETQGLEALTRGEIEDARNLLERAAAAAKSHGDRLTAEVNAKIAHCCWEMGDAEAARDAYRGVFAQLAEDGKHHDALIAASDLIHVDHEWAPELHLILARLLVEEGDKTTALQHALEASDTLRRTGNSDLASQAVELALTLAPEDPRVRAAVCEDALEHADWEKVADHLPDLVEISRESGAPERAHLVLNRLSDTDHLNAEMRLEWARLCEEMGRDQEAEAIWEDLIPLGQADEDLADEVADHLLDQEERTPERESQLLNLLLRAQRIDEAREALRRLILAEADEQIIRDAFQALTSVLGDDLSIRQERLGWMAARGDADAIHHARNLLRDAAEARDISAAQEAWGILSLGAGTGEESLAIRSEAIPLMVDLVGGEEHRVAWQDLVQEAFETKAFDMAHGHARRYLETVGYESSVAKRCLSALQQSGHLAENVDFARRVFDLQRNAKDWKGAERTLMLLIEALQNEDTDSLWDDLSETLCAGGNHAAAAALHLQRAEGLLQGGETPLAERQLSAARVVAPDQWSHWRLERAAVRRGKHTGISERLVIEAVEAASKETAEDCSATNALIEEAREGVLESFPFARLIRILAERGETETAGQLVEEHGSSILGQGIDAQRELGALVEVLPGCSALWRLAIERVNDSEAVEAFHLCLSTLWQSEALEPSERLALAQRAALRWPDAIICLEALAVCERTAGNMESAVKTEQQLATRLMKENEPERAIEILERLVMENDESPVMRRQLALALERAGKEERAGRIWISLAMNLGEVGGDSALIREALESARRLCGDTSEILLAEFNFCERAMDEEGATERAIALADHHVEEGDTEAALDVLKQCIETFGETLGLLHAQAKTLESGGQVEAAARLWRRVLDRHWERAEWDGCAEALANVQRLEPDQIEDLERLAHLEQNRGHNEHVHESLVKIIDVCADNPEAAATALEDALEWLADPCLILERLAALRLSMGDRRQAVSHQRRAIDLHLKRGEIEQAEALLLAVAEMAAEDLDLRMALLSAFEAHWDQERMILEHLALIKGCTDDEAALNALAQVRARWPHSIEALRQEAALLMRAGQEEKAIQRLRDIVREAQRAENFTQAIETAQRIVELKSSTLTDKWTLAELLRADGRKTAALQLLRQLADECRERNATSDLIRAYEAMLEIEPGHPGALGDLAETCAAAGDIAGATKRWLQLAELHMANNRRAPAERAYRQILENDGDCLAALAGLFELYEQQENPRRLVVIARRLLEIEATHKWASAERLAKHMAAQHPDADDFFHRWADLLWEHGKRNEATEELETRANRLHTEGRTGASLDMLQHLLLLLPERLDIAQRIGQIAFEMGDEDRARRAWKEALAGHRALGDIDGEHAVLRQLHSLNPDDPEMGLALAEASINVGESARALELLLQVLARRREEGDADAQRRTLERIVNLDPNRAAEQKALSDLLRAAGNDSKAMEHLQRALGAYREQARWDEAADVAKELAEMLPEDPSIRQLHGEALSKAGHAQDALEVFSELGAQCEKNSDLLNAELAWRAVLDIDPRSIVAHEHLARVLIEQEQRDEAAELTQWLADTHRESGDTEGERSALLQITKLRPENTKAHRRLARLCLEGGDIEGAWLSFRRLLTEAELTGDLDLWRDLEREVLDSSADPRLRVELAQMHAEAGRQDEALRLFTEVCESHLRAEDPSGVRRTALMILHLDPNNIHALEMLVEVLPALQDETNTSAPQMKRRLADALLPTGECERALKIYEDLALDAPKDRETQIGLARAAMKLQRKTIFDRALDMAIKPQVERGHHEWIINVCQDLLEGDEDPCPWPRPVREHMVNAIVATKTERTHSHIFTALAEDCEADGDIMRAVEVYEMLLAATHETQLRLRFIDFLQQHGQHTRAVHELIAISDVYRAEGDRRREVTVLERARELDGENVQVLLRLGEVLCAQNAKGRALEVLQQAAQMARRQGENEILPDLLRQILQIDDEDMSTRRALVDLLSESGQREEAVKEHLKLADQCLRKGLLDLAAQSFRSVVQIEPQNLEAWHNLVETHLQFGAEEDLIHDFLTVARLCQGEGKPKDAAKWYRRYLNLSANDIEVRKEFIETFEEFAEGLDLMGELNEMAEALHRAGRADEAKNWEQRSQRLAEKMIKTDPKPKASAPRTPTRPKTASPPPRKPVVRLDGQKRSPEPPKSTMRAAGASSKRDQRQAPVRKPDDTNAGMDPMLVRLEQYRSHLESDPNNARLHQQMAEILIHMGQNDEAHRHHREAALIFGRQAAWPQCEQMCRRVLNEDPDDREIQNLLTQVTG